MPVAASQQRVFISYARVDAGEVAERLREDLEDHDVRAWLDNVEMGGGASLSEQIELAIDECSTLLALLTRGSYRSTACRAEQIRALRKGKLVVPVIVEQGVDRPLHLEHLLYRDLADPSRYDVAFREILADIADGNISPLPEVLEVTRVSAPPFPPHLVDRLDAVVALRELLIRDDAPSLVGLYGMGGLGKTVMAKMLSRDAVVQDAFPDGIVWVTLGSDKEDLQVQLQEAVTCLTRSEYHAETSLAARNELRTHLQGKAALLILDDVANAGQIEQFRTDVDSAPNVRILFTTRDRTVGLQTAAEMHPAPPFEPAESVRLLESWAGRIDPSANSLAQRLGHLPLALRIAGTQMSDDMSAAELLGEYQHLSDIRIDRYSDEPEANLRVVFDSSAQRLDADDRLLYDSLGVLANSFRVPLRLVWTLWRTQDPTLSGKECARIARTLERRSLLELADDRMTLHPLLHDYTAERAPPESDLAHRAVDGLERGTRDAQSAVREMAIATLGRIGGESAFTAALRLASTDEDIDVELTALSVLGQVGDPRAVPLLIDVLRKNNFETTLEAANALSGVGHDAVLPLISALASLTSVGLRDGMLALGWLGDHRALPVLESLEQHPDASFELHTSTGAVTRNASVDAQLMIRTEVDRRTY